MGNMNKKPTIIRVRSGINGFKYSACNVQGKWIGNFNKLGDVRKHWFKEIELGYVVLVRELNQMPTDYDVKAQEEQNTAGPKQKIQKRVSIKDNLHSKQSQVEQNKGAYEQRERKEAVR